MNRKSYIKLTIAVVLVSIVVVIKIIASKPSIFPIRYVQVKASFEHVKPEEVRTVVRPFLAASFFSLNVGKLKLALLQIPWIYKVDVSRKWLDSLEIDIQEQTAIAKLNGYALLNPNGEIFIPDKSSFSDVPELFTPAEDYEQEALRTYLLLHEQLTTTGLGIKQLVLSHNHEWSMILYNNITILFGIRNPVTQLPIFLKIYKKVIGADASRVKVVDLRFDKGFALKWR